MGRNKYKVARRSIWYILSILLTLAALLTLILGVFMAGLYTSNVYIILQDGMEKRADCILCEGSLWELSEYFTDDFLLNDEELTKHAYADFTVSAYDYRVEVEKLLVMPWEKETTVRVVQKLASIAAAPNEQGENILPPALPEWPTTLCEVGFIQKDGRWYISSLTVLETNPLESPLPTPDLSLIAK